MDSLKQKLRSPLTYLEEWYNRVNHLILPATGNSSPENVVSGTSPQTQVLYRADSPTPDEVRNSILPDESLSQLLVRIITPGMAYDLTHVRYVEKDNETNRSFVYVHATPINNKSGTTEVNGAVYNDNGNFLEAIAKLVDGTVMNCLASDYSIIILNERLTQAQVASLIRGYGKNFGNGNGNVTVPSIAYRNPPVQLLQSAHPNSLEARLRKIDLHESTKRTRHADPPQPVQLELIPKKDLYLIFSKIPTQ